MNTSRWNNVRSNLQHPRLLLCCYLIAWKALLLLVALTSPGPGYDTSSSLSLDLPSTKEQHETHAFHFEAASQSNLILKLTRWDALYFTKIAQDGYTYEQEWMAGFGFTRLLSFLSSFESSIPQMPLASLVGICLAHISHLLSVLVLYDLGLLSLGSYSESKRSFMALLAACLHIISPAGIFLSAPYAESLFSLTSFFGFYLYAKGLSPLVEGRRAQNDLFTLSAGVCLGLATTIRANGLLNGLIFVYEAAAIACTLVFQKRARNYSNVRHLCIVVCAGTLMGSISFMPQYFAYLDYCVPQPRRPWCSRLMPSIYTWIQSEYWQVGLLKYWTFSNLPLFILAMPILAILFVSGFWALPNTARSLSQKELSSSDQRGNRVKQVAQFGLKVQHKMLIRLALPQLALALLGLTMYHVQIITRLSSGYPVWYWWLAHIILKEAKDVGSRKRMGAGLVITRWMVIYAVIQGGLFASFLPPA